MNLRPVKLKIPVATFESRSNGEDGSKWYVWSDNVGEQTLSCLPYSHTGDCGFFVYDLQTFRYDKVIQVPRLLDVAGRAARTVSGMIEVAVPSSDFDDVSDACKAGLLQMVGNGVARITQAGRESALMRCATAIRLQNADTGISKGMA